VGCHCLAVGFVSSCDDLLHRGIAWVRIVLDNIMIIYGHDIGEILDSLDVQKLIDGLSRQFTYLVP
jgi:hypothetical protein